MSPKEFVSALKKGQNKFEHILVIGNVKLEIEKMKISSLVFRDSRIEGKLTLMNGDLKFLSFSRTRITGDPKESEDHKLSQSESSEPLKRIGLLIQRVNIKNFFYAGLQAVIELESPKLKVRK